MQSLSGDGLPKLKNKIKSEVSIILARTVYIMHTVPILVHKAAKCSDPVYKKTIKLTCLRVKKRLIFQGGALI